MVNLDVLQQLLNHIDRYTLCKTTDKILLAVSGGLDSMVLLQLLKVAGYTVGVVHCNFQLRGKDAFADEEFVKSVCEQNNIPFFARRFDTTTYATDKGISIQMAARDLRYAYFQEVAQFNGFDLVATAHHFSDTIESVFLNLVRGTGIDGFRGIAPKKQNIIRPLLFATRAQILDHALKQGISWREDASNESDDYQRNFLRHQVIPRFQEMNHGFEQSFYDTHERLLGAREFALHYIDAVKTAAVTVRNNKVLIDIHQLHASRAPAVLLWELIKDLGFKYDQCKQIAMHHQPGKMFYSDSHGLLVDRTHYIIDKKGSSSGFETVIIEKGQRTVGESPFILVTREVSGNEFLLRKDAGIAQLDADKLQFPLIWRKWQAGDYFVPLGMEAEKKVSDFLIDLKIPFNSKADVTVLQSGKDIVWVVGHRISERFKVTSSTARIFIIEQHHSSV